MMEETNITSSSSSIYPTAMISTYHSIETLNEQQSSMINIKDPVEQLLPPTTYLIHNNYPTSSLPNETMEQSSMSNITTNSILSPISSYQIPTYMPPSVPQTQLTGTSKEESLELNSSNPVLPISQTQYQIPVFTPPMIPSLVPTHSSGILQQQQPIYCSDGIIYPNELESSNNVITNKDERDITLSDDLIDVYNHLGIVGKILTRGSLVTIRFLQMFRNLSETLVDALGIARPKYENEIQAFKEMKQEEQQRQAKIQQLYETWKSPPPPPPSSLFENQLSPQPDSFEHQPSPTVSSSNVGIPSPNSTVSLNFEN